MVSHSAQNSNDMHRYRDSIRVEIWILFCRYSMHRSLGKFRNEKVVYVSILRMRTNKSLQDKEKKS